MLYFHLFRRISSLPHLSTIIPSKQFCQALGGCIDLKYFLLHFYLQFSQPALREVEACLQEFLPSSLNGVSLHSLSLLGETYALSWQLLMIPVITRQKEKLPPAYKRLEVGLSCYRKAVSDYMHLCNVYALLYQGFQSKLGVRAWALLWRILFFWVGVFHIWSKQELKLNCD